MAGRGGAQRTAASSAIFSRLLRVGDCWPVWCFEATLATSPSAAAELLSEPVFSAAKMFVTAAGAAAGGAGAIRLRVLNALVLVMSRRFSPLDSALRASSASNSTDSPGSATCSRIVAIADIWLNSRTMWQLKGSEVRLLSPDRERSNASTCPHASAHLECMFFTCVTPSQ